MATLIRPASGSLARSCAAARKSAGASASASASASARAVCRLADCSRAPQLARHGSIATSRVCTRAFASEAVKPTIANIAEVRKQLPGTSMIKAREALSASENDVSGALQWLEKDMQATGAKKASKVGDRTAREGGIGICILSDGVPVSSTERHAPSGMQVEGITLGARAGIVELNCETDFVGRNEIFQGLLKNIAHTVALFPSLATEEAAPLSADASPSHGTQQLIDIPVEQLLDFPLLTQHSAATAATATPKTVGAAIIDTISRLGERINLSRASALSSTSVPSPNAPRRSTTNEPRAPWHVASAFIHGGQSQPASAAAATAPGTFASSGRVGSLLLTRVQTGTGLPKADGKAAAQLAALRGLTRSLARQTAGMPTRSIRKSETGDAESALYHQPFMMRLAAAQLPGSEQVGSSDELVEEALQSWGKEWLAITSDADTDNSGVQAVTEQAPIEVIELRRWQLGEAM